MYLGSISWDSRAAASYRKMEIGHAFTCILLVVLCLQPAKPQDWQWKCSGGRNCIRVDPGSGDNGYTSIAECRFLCNEFSTLWPRPTGQITLSRKTIEVDASQLTVDVQGVNGADEGTFLQNAVHILKETLHSECPSKGATPISVKIFTTLPGLESNWSTDESYTIHVNHACPTHKAASDCSQNVMVDIHAQTVYGARHALETLGQLTVCRNPGKGAQLLMMSTANITDMPAYAHRGLLIDSSRRYLSIDTIKRTLRAMSWNKMNVLHWHITDSHSFPFQSNRVPIITRQGAYSKDEIYTKEDVLNITAYAKERGIRILLEVDAPSHSGNGWDWDNQGLCVNEQPWRSCGYQPPCGQLNPTEDKLYSTLSLLYKDFWEAFQPWAFHMGGDEVVYGCWNQSTDIKSWLKEHKLQPTETGFMALWKQFQDSALEVWDNVAGEMPILLWSSDMTNPQWITKYLNNSRYVIQTWTDATDPQPQKLLNLGYKIVVSTRNAWYLDHGFSSGQYHPWNVVYNNRILPANRGVYGGEVCMWGELVGDSNIDVKVWPRASCAAERLWSNPDDTADHALPRLQNHLDTLIRRGINADEIQPEWCSQNDGMCL